MEWIGFVVCIGGTISYCSLAFYVGLQPSPFEETVFLVASGVAFMVIGFTLKQRFEQHKQTEQPTSIKTKTSTD